jgi:hypothetical protein
MNVTILPSLLVCRLRLRIGGCFRLLGCSCDVINHNCCDHKSTFSTLLPKVRNRFAEGFLDGTDPPRLDLSYRSIRHRPPHGRLAACAAAMAREATTLHFFAKVVSAGKPCLRLTLNLQELRRANTLGALIHNLLRVEGRRARSG